MSRRIWLIIALAAALYVLGNGRVQLWDRDEPRYAQASRQMLQSGDWVVPMLLDEPRIKKPPMIYWCQAACMAVLGDNAFAARLPSVIAMVLTLMVLGSTMVRAADERRAFWAVLIMATSGLVIMAAKMCLTDAVLLLFVTTAQLSIHAIWRGQRDWWTIIVFAIATGLGLLTKGPVVLGVNAMTLVMLAWYRWWDGSQLNRKGQPQGFEVITTASAQPVPEAARSPQSAIDNPQSAITSPRPILKSIIALLIILFIVLPWVIAMQLRLPGGLMAVFNKEILQRMSEPLEQHKGPPGYYLLFFFASFFPWCLLLPTALKWAWRRRNHPLVRFSLAAVVGPWLMFELIQTKLPHYVLPCMPFLAILVAEVIVCAIEGKGRLPLLYSGEGGGEGLRTAKSGAPLNATKDPHPNPLPSTGEGINSGEGTDEQKIVRELTARGFFIGVCIWAGAVILLGLAPWVAALPDLKFDRLPYAAMSAVSLIAIAGAIWVLHAFWKREIARGAFALGGTMFALFMLLFGWYVPSARFLHLSEEVGKFLRLNGATTKGEIVMIDYKEDSLPFYQGGTIRAQPTNAYLATTQPDDWPEYLTITREIWDQTPEAAKARLKVLGTFRGWAYAAKGRVVDVLVVMKRPQ